MCCGSGSQRLAWEPHRATTRPERWLKKIFCGAASPGTARRTPGWHGLPPGASARGHSWRRRPLGRMAEAGAGRTQTGFLTCWRTRYIVYFCGGWAAGHPARPARPARPAKPAFLAGLHSVAGPSGPLPLGAARSTAAKVGPAGSRRAAGGHPGTGTAGARMRAVGMWRMSSLVSGLGVCCRRLPGLEPSFSVRGVGRAVVAVVVVVVVSVLSVLSAPAEASEPASPIAEMQSSSAARAYPGALHPWTHSGPISCRATHRDGCTSPKRHHWASTRAPACAEPSPPAP